MASVKVGECIEILEMQGEPAYSGRKGRITHIDDAGQIHGTWGGLAVIPETDRFRKIEDIYVRKN